MPLPRRSVLGGGLAAVAATLAGCADESAPVWAEPATLPVAEQTSVAP